MMSTDESLASAILRAKAAEPVWDPLAPFLGAVKAAFGFSSFSWELCAEQDGFRRADRCFTLDDQPLAQNWSTLGHGYWGHPSNLLLRPPRYLRGKIDQWVEKCAESMHRARNVRIFLLTSANMASTWFNTWVVSNARVYVVRGRVGVFDRRIPGNTQMLSVFDGTSRGIELWDWRSPQGVQQGGVAKPVVSPVSPTSNGIVVQ
jgi:hypothetical protein